MVMEKSNSDWSEVEIQAAVDAYLRMWSCEQKEQAYNKAHENRVLREGVLAERTKSSIEFRMQNISSVMVELGREPIKGYKPAKNVGANVARSIRTALDASSVVTPEDFDPTADEAKLEQRAAKFERQPFLYVPKGIKNPVWTETTRKTYFRDPELRGWVRQQANGKCEGCGELAPFKRMGNRFWKPITLNICRKRVRTLRRMLWRYVPTVTNVATIRTTELNSLLGFMPTLEDSKRNNCSLSD